MKHTNSSCATTYNLLINSSGTWKWFSCLNSRILNRSRFYPDSSHLKGVESQNRTDTLSGCCTRSNTWQRYERSNGNLVATHGIPTPDDLVSGRAVSARLLSRQQKAFRCCSVKNQPSEKPVRAFSVRSTAEIAWRSLSDMITRCRQHIVDMTERGITTKTAGPLVKTWHIFLTVSCLKKAVSVVKRRLIRKSVNSNLIHNKLHDMIS